MTTSTRPARSSKDKLTTELDDVLETPSTRKTKATSATVSTARALALDAGNYDLKFYDGTGNPKAIRSVRYQLPMGRDPVRYTDFSPLVELPDGTRYHFGAQAYKYRRQQQTVVENKVEQAKLHLYACLEPIDGTVSEFPLTLYVSTPNPDKHAEGIK
ncbi:MAG TPA: hypothetical protein V6C88_18510, partial [Chroococcidiopsis sp.]